MRAVAEVRAMLILSVIVLVVLITIELDLWVTR